MAEASAFGCCIGVRIGVLRRRRGLTQAELAGLIDRSVEAVSSLERGKHMPSLDILQRLSEALDVPVRDFFAPDGGDGDNPKQAALYSELLDAARTLPLADLELAAGMVGLMARRIGG